MTVRENFDHNTEQQTKDFVQTYGCNVFYFDEMEKNELSIETIAHTLTQIPRWSGNTWRRYPVTEHLLHVHDKLEELYPDNRTVQFEGLMHDVPEYITLDFPRPIKSRLHDYTMWNLGVEVVIGRKFGYDHMMSKEVKSVDDRMLVTEYQYFIDVGELAPLNLINFETPYDDVDFEKYEMQAADENYGDYDLFLKHEFIRRFNKLKRF